MKNTRTPRTKREHRVAAKAFTRHMATITSPKATDPAWKARIARAAAHSRRQLQAERAARLKGGKP